ncbi:MAG: metallophosphoesterase [Armatimonadia bacterium]
MRLCLIHTSDLHGRLTVRQAQRLRQLKQDRQALLLDSGDALGSPNLFSYPWNEAVVSAMNEAGYDALCMGNREFGLLSAAMRGKLGRMRFPVLAANVQVQRGQYPQLQRWTILDTNGLRVGVFGLSQPLLRGRSLWERAAAVRHTDALTAAREAIHALQPETDLLVALTHYGEKPEHDLAAACPELSAILAGHWHVQRPSLELAGRTAISRTFAHARGAAILTFDGTNWTQEVEQL